VRRRSKKEEGARKNKQKKVKFIFKNALEFRTPKSNQYF